MNDTVADLVLRGRALPAADRERLVEQLLETLNEAATRELDSQWAAEIESRLAAYDRGEVQAVEAAAVFAKVNAIAR